MSEVDVGGRRYVVDEHGARAVSPVLDRGLRLVVDGREITSDDLTLAGVNAVDGLRGPNAVDGLRGPNAVDGLRGPNAVDGLRGRNAVDGLRGPNAVDGLAWRLVGAGLVVDMAVKASGHVQLTVAGMGRLEHVEVERWAASPGLGQPVMGEGWFAGLEHPGAEDLGLAVDIDLARGPFVAPPLVVGFTPPGHELAGLWDELDRVRARPARLVVLANNWYQLGAVGRMDQQTVVAELGGFGAVAARHDLDLDWYCLDDPWDGDWVPDTGLWGRLDPARFPDGLAGLQAAGRAGGIGLWVSPWGGYFDRHDARVAWGGDHGFEVQDGSWPRLCPAGDRYRRHLAESLGRFTAAGVGYWKLDGVQFDCQERHHGHPVGPGGRTAQMDRFAELLDGLRAACPDTVLTFTTGSNPSPWWLRHADFVWRGGLDDDAPAGYDGGRHERFATYIDECLDALRSSAVPVSAIVTFSVVENGARAYRDEGEGLDAWERHCWLLAARGTHHHDLYVAPDSLTGDEWDALAGALRWARSNQAVLARSRMVGGRPQAGEPYGFLSVRDGKAILCLRNPSGRSQPVPADLGGELSGVEAVWGGPLDAELAPFEVVVLSGRWRAENPLGRRG